MRDELVLLEFRHAYRKCESCFNTAERESMKNDFHQRMDEILLLYSALFGGTTNEAKEQLKLNDANVSGEEQ